MSATDHTHHTRPRGNVLLRLALGLLHRAEANSARRRSCTPGSHLAVNVVDDPNGRMHLIGVRGTLTSHTVPALAAALMRVPDGSGLHLDVTDTEIDGAAALDEIERLIDRLELRGVRIRIVGLDPRHPALSYHRPR